MSKIMRIWSLLIAADILLLGVWTAFRILGPAENVSTLEISPLLVGAGVLAALLTLATNQTRAESEDLLESANDLIAKAYSTLEKSRDTDGRPSNDRIIWLTSARLLLTAENIGQKLTVNSHKIVWEETREYWRGQLRELISPNGEGFPSEYYAVDAQSFIHWSARTRSPISEASLAVLYRFIDWPEGRKDPLQQIKRFSEDEISRMSTRGPKGLGDLLKNARLEARKYLK